MKKYNILTGDIMQCSKDKWFNKIIDGTFEGPLNDVLYQEKAILVKDSKGNITDITKLSVLDIMRLHLVGYLPLINNSLVVKENGDEAGELFINPETISAYIPKTEAATSLIALRREAKKQYSMNKGQ